VLRSNYFTPIAFFSCAAALVAAACSSDPAGTTTTTTSSSSSSSSGLGGAGGGGGQGGGIPAVTFTPMGCSFSIAARPEYKEFAPAKSESAAAPNIRRVRLGLGGNVAVESTGRADPATSIAFAWQTDDGTTASDVQWGSDPDPTKWAAANHTSGVTWLTPAGMINAAGDERMHEAYVCGLTPATTYYYRVGGGAAGKEVWSDVFSFTTTPSDNNASVTFGVTGDSRGENDDAWHLIAQRMHSAGVTLQLFSGDMVNLAPDQTAWEHWLDSAWKDTDGKPLTLAETLILAAHGNHETHTTLFYGNLVQPQDTSKYLKYAELFYSFDVGPVHLVIFDDAFLVDIAQDNKFGGIFGDWLNADLDKANKNRAKVPWIVAVHHHGEFSSGNHGMDADVLRGRAYTVPIWDKYHVNLVLAGHDHNYERSKPLTGPADTPTIKQSSKDGTTYVICAGSGADSYTPGMSNFTEVSHGYGKNGSIGVYGLLKADPKKLVLEAHELHADASDPVFDTLTIQ
jgi:hypothetical protein